MPDINQFAEAQPKVAVLDRKLLEAYLLIPSSEPKSFDSVMKPPQSIIMSGVRWDVTYTHVARPDHNGSA